jgi:hypothetical protein
MVFLFAARVALVSSAHLAAALAILVAADRPRRRARRWRLRLHPASSLQDQVWAGCTPPLSLSLLRCCSYPVSPFFPPVVSIAAHVVSFPLPSTSLHTLHRLTFSPSPPPPLCSLPPRCGPSSTSSAPAPPSPPARSSRSTSSFENSSVRPHPHSPFPPLPHTHTVSAVRMPDLPPPCHRAPTDLALLPSAPLPPPPPDRAPATASFRPRR